MSNMEYYNILGINKNATSTEIRKAYKKMAVRWHPDKNQDNKAEAEKKFKEIAEAYQILSDPEKKKIYDQYGKNGLNGGFNNFGGHGTHFHSTNIDPNEIFREFFGGSFNSFGNNDQSSFNNFGSGRNFKFSTNIGNNNQKPKNNIIIHYIECTIEELYKGSNKQIYMEKLNKNFNIQIEKGWKSGTKISYENDGVIFIIKQLKHNNYICENNNIIMESKISLLQALKGFDISVASIDGTMHNIKIGPLINNLHIIKGYGMPVRKNNKIVEYGDFIIKFIIHLGGIEYYQKMEILKILDK